MDRVISDEERIRRAEEILARRRNKIPVSNFSIEETREVRISRFGKFFLQTITSICIFGIMYFLSQNYSYAMDKIKPVMDDDTDFNKLYGYMNSIFSNIINDEQATNNNVTENNEEVNEENVSEISGNISLAENIESLTDENNPIKMTEGNNNELNNEQENVESASNIASLNINNQSDEKLDDISYIKKYANIIKPVNGVVTSWYGSRKATDIVSAYHKGIDIGASIGTPIYSSMDGEVSLVSEYGDYGKHIKITNGEVSILYAHCSKIDVNEGEKIVQGQKIAEVGTTGKSTGPHLHIEIMRDDRNVDPAQIINFWTYMWILKDDII